MAADEQHEQTVPDVGGTEGDKLEASAPDSARVSTETDDGNSFQLAIAAGRSMYIHLSPGSCLSRPKMATSRLW